MNDLATVHAELERAGITFHKAGLTVPDGLEQRSWASLTAVMYRAGGAMQWWLGDLLAFGEKHYGSLKLFSEAMNVPYSSLNVYAWTCRAIELIRRRISLSFGHHVEVAAMKPKEQDKWLDKAEQNGWSVVELRSAIRLAEAETDGKLADGNTYQAPTRYVDGLKRFFNNPPDGLYENDDLKQFWIGQLDPLVKIWAKLKGAE